ncbi:MAG: Phosphate transport system permease protein PstC [Chroococcidiopsis cubana SAG 39.79]|uniref:Phosphate transport system permease protein n=1 Tax=Chroococcidiopsis cubana SAG 39.79 TaxID=388085 RepID=A0AB37UGN4_9CYAN|nr:phosphate ABC transporter permease subunit PstC [Chroococcidiopsis cubana]MDZ4877004.1 Phosphate transport system permease protein PstC [Chroococcidiopsis cubana SAG 39.79]PSB65894.1 phosphate ABC transporter permease subunit PstC [Chroococcidiopsis cubana CCALA 043]RUT10751.1 phosphate ABC transporter permease subunit PstC [Chroococcidiopsis cubana SAG 39.79]
MSPYRSEIILVWILRAMALLVAAIVLSIVLFLLWETLPILQTVGLNRFFNDPSWHPSSEEFNLLPMLWGTLFVTVGAVLLATPLGILSAVFCQYYAPVAIASLYRRLIELLAGIPSVVYGFWGLVVLVPLVGRIRPPGASLLTGILILTLMILPTITLVAHSSLASVPPEYLRGCAAMGLGRWATVSGVVLPAMRSGLLTSVILGTGRAIGETMAVLMVCGNVVQVPLSVFEPVRTLTANIALEMAYAVGNHRAALFVSGLVLMAMVVALVVAAELLSRGQIYD